MEAIILGVLTLIGSIITVIVSYFGKRRESKSTEIEASASLINAALGINKQELETARVLNTILLEDYKNQKTLYDLLLGKFQFLSDKYDELEKKYKECIETLELKN